MSQSESIAKLADALCKFQSTLKPVKNTKEVRGEKYSYTYSDLASVLDAIREPLASNGLAVSQLPYIGPDGTPGLSTILMHTSGEWISGDLAIRPTRNDPQSIGSALTYARRYALSAITGVATEDDDAEAATREVPKPLATSRPAPQSTPRPPAPPQADGASFVWRIGTKYKGTKIEDLPKDYLEWFQKNGKVEDHLIATDLELERRNTQELPLTDYNADTPADDDAVLFDENGQPF